MVMNTSLKTAILLSASSVLLLAVSSRSAAQYYQYPPPAYPPPPVYAPYAGPGGYLAGAANVIDAQGQYYQQEEAARQMREQTIQENLKTKKAAVEYNKWLEANTPTYTEQKEKEKGMQTRRLLNDPTTLEITSGSALNALLPFLGQMSKQGMQGPPVPLNPATLARINLMGPVATGALGMLSNHGQLDWPLVLRGQPTQKQLAKEVTQVVMSSSNGTLQYKDYIKTYKGVVAYRDNVKNQFAKDEIDAASFLQADDFLQKLGFALVELNKPGAQKTLSGAYKANGRTVQELVQNMAGQGLQFAPATPGDEGAYVALYNAMSTYAISAQNSFGFQLQTVAPRKEFAVQN
jgi:hypothetical protein